MCLTRLFKHIHTGLIVEVCDSYTPLTRLLHASYTPHYYTSLYYRCSTETAGTDFVRSVAGRRDGATGVVKIELSLDRHA